MTSWLNAAAPDLGATGRLPCGLKLIGPQGRGVRRVARWLRCRSLGHCGLASRGLVQLDSQIGRRCQFG